MIVKAWSSCEEGEVSFDDANLKPLVCKLDQLCGGVVIPLAGKNWFLQLVWNENWDQDDGGGHALVFRETSEPVSDLKVWDYLKEGLRKVRGRLPQDPLDAALILDLENGIPLVPSSHEVVICGQPMWPSYHDLPPDPDARPLLTVKLPGGDSRELDVFVSLAGKEPQIYVSYDFS